MDFKSAFETFKGKATDLAQSGVAETKRLTEIAKLKTANMAEEDAIKKAYVELGKLYYAEHGAAPDGAYAAACEKITASKALIETNKERIEELKASSAPEEEAEAEAEVRTETERVIEIEVKDEPVAEPMVEIEIQQDVGGEEPGEPIKTEDAPEI